MAVSEPQYYLGGPMRGYEALNFPAFDRAKRMLEALGLSIVSPADIDREEFGEGFEKTFDPQNIPEDMLEQIIIRDVEAVLQCKGGIILLDGWENSSGANGELGIANWAGRSVFRYHQATDKLTLLDEVRPLSVADGKIEI